MGDQLGAGHHTSTLIEGIDDKDQTLVLSPVEQRKIGLAVRERLIAIMTGKVPDPYAWVEAL